jgi:hypothetical protein
MTQAEFNTHYKEYLSSWEKKYKHLDLNFDMVMFMRGVSKEEFDEKIKYVNVKSWTETMSQDNISENDNGYGDVDVEDYVDENNSSDEGKSQDYNVWIDGEGDGY